ncbi:MULTISPECIES: TlyA family RNA methyltransferase [unclassified Microcoleus]|uniref:TlyA family RNA methyltransferase n=1 Tax=unclassified Microcoleus TaxID=2642155 RepID=UPI0025D3FC61|nr:MULTISPECIES: TlyA family RNA methyltransferase [unclassified Microcoleus]
MAKQRIDTLLVDLDLCTSRQQAQALIRTGQVSIDQQVIDKPGTEVDIAANILIKQRSRYVSRGGDKLAKALEIFAIPVTDRICLDGGISTGGFTDCLLQAGAALVYGIDVGYGQADWRLRNDPRVILKERTNLRYMTATELYGDSPRADLAVVDVSFISLDKVLPALWELLAPPREAVLLVKPQFEVGRDRVGKKGVVRDSATQADAIFQVWKAATALGWQERGLTWSPLLGPAGNIEYLLWLGIDREQEPDQSAILFEGCANEEGVVKERIAQVAKAAAQELVK